MALFLLGRPASLVLNGVGGSHGVMSEAGLVQKSKGRWVPAPLGFISHHPLRATHFRDGKTEGKNLPEASQPWCRVEPASPHSPSLPRCAPPSKCPCSGSQGLPWVLESPCDGRGAGESGKASTKVKAGLRPAR